jgi:hypothetical protein
VAEAKPPIKESLQEGHKMDTKEMQKKFSIPEYDSNPFIAKNFLFKNKWNTKK